jgi:tRNA nucleotidyltransferase/poly(A) polymerase
MRKEDHIAHILQSRRELSFIDGFLADHPTTGLYIVGGAVRDLLLNRRFREFDFDFVITSLPPDAIEAWFKQWGELNLVGQHFGVYKFMPEGFTTKDIDFIDLALPRTEAVADGSLGGYKDFDVQSDPELPIEDDLARRDFTINAMAFDVRTKTLIDPYNGQTDLEARVIRAVGIPSDRFKEDLSRMLRAIRFAAELGFEIETNTAKAIQHQIDSIHTQREIDSSLHWVVPRETVGIELAKAFARKPVRALELMKSLDLLPTLFPDAKFDLEPTMATTPGELTIVLALLLNQTPVDRARELLTFTGLDTLPKDSSHRTEASTILWLINHIQEPRSTQDVEQMPASQFEKIFLNGKGNALIRCLELMGKQELVQAAIHRRKQIEGRWLVDHDESIAPLLSGQDVLALGISAGPQIRVWLDRVRDQQLDGDLMRREEALAWLENEQNKSIDE